MGHQYDIYTIEAKTVADYCRISILEVDDLDLVSYLCYIRDARVHTLMQTEKGQEYLKNAWRIEQTAPDRKRLREKYKK